MKHTKEPWAIEQNGNGWFVVPPGADKDEDMPAIADLGHYGNARRIVVAVNACAGIPTEALEADVVRRMREALVVFEGLCDAYAHDGVENAQKSRDLVRQLLKEVDGQ